jgi:N-acetylglucosaminyl-diphospho-decaprenol L-rhamnosyltransferase
VTSTAVVTIVHGRHDHLAVQYRGLAASTVRPDIVILVDMDDPGLSPADFGDIRPTIVHLPSGANGLPLAAARNAGARAALDAGAGTIIFLDVDCIPAPALVETYAAAAHDERWSGSLLCGPVAYLPPAPPSGYVLAQLDRLAEPHPARPAPAPGDIVASRDFALFWSLSFAVTAATWQRLGGFREDYEGYGAEDTDFARAAQAAGVDLAWVGAARAFHQYHPTSTPPVQHLGDIVRNATIYRERWGDWPMSGWLEEFARAGLVEWTDERLVISRAKPIKVSD